VEEGEALPGHQESLNSELSNYTLVRRVYRIFWVDRELAERLSARAREVARERAKVRGVISDIVNEALRRYIERHGLDKVPASRRSREGRVVIRAGIDEDLYRLIVAGLSRPWYGRLTALVEEALREYLSQVRGG